MGRDRDGVAVKIGVTGGTGFIGGHVVNELILRGHEPVVFDVRGRGHMMGDIRDATAVTELAAHVDGIIHLAAVLGTQETVGNPGPAAETNILGGLNILNACRQYELPLVNIAVGNHWMLNPYSISKSTVEKFCTMYHQEHGVQVNQVRAVNAYGPGQSAPAPYGSAKVRKIIPSMVCRALSGDPIEVYGDGLQVSDMVYVADVAYVLVTALEQAAQGVAGETVEVGPETHSTVLEVAELVADTTVRQTGMSVSIRHLPMRPGEIPGARVTADQSTLEVFGVDPGRFTGLSEGVARTVSWFRDNEGVSWTRPTVAA